MRFISNESSGKQGYEIALELSRLGIKTTLISGPTNLSYNSDIKVQKVVSGNDMLEAVKKNYPLILRFVLLQFLILDHHQSERVKLKKIQK